MAMGRICLIYLTLVWVNQGVALAKPVETDWKKALGLFSEEAVSGVIEDIRRTGRPSVPELLKAFESGTRFEPAVPMNVAYILGVLDKAEARGFLLNAAGEPEAHHPVTRRHVVFALGLIGNPNDIPPLKAISKTKQIDPELSEYFELSLKMMGESSPVRELCVALKGERSTLKRLVARVLGDLKDPAAIGPLVDCLKNDGLGGAGTIPARSLRQITGRNFGYAGNKTEGERERAIQRWVSWAKTTVPLSADRRAEAERLIKQLAADDPKTRAEAETKLSAMGVVIGGLLRKQLEGADPEVSARARVILLKVDKAFPLEAAVRTGSKKERAEALSKLGEMRSAPSLPVILEAAASPEAPIRSRALEALLLFKDPGLEEPILKRLGPILRSTNVDERASSTFFLKQMDGAEARKQLLALLDDEDAPVREDAAYAYFDTKWKSGVPRLVELLTSDPSARVRAVAALSLGEIGDPRSLDALRAAAGDESRDVRRRAAEALRRIELTR